MSGASDDLLYQYAGIDTVAGAISSFVAQMNANLDEVDGKFKNLIAQGWHGAGANAFQGKSAQWHAAANEMASTLQQLSTKVGNAAVNMQAADSAAAARF
jgi:WXG100 family type VII secretion target